MSTNGSPTPRGASSTFLRAAGPGASLARASLPRTPYVAAYLIDNDAVRIQRVLHGAQIWSDEFTKDH
jgi:plasmid stabilization system protein ParE